MNDTPRPSFDGDVLDDDVLWERLGHLLAGELSAEEEAQLLSWIAADPQRQQLLAVARELWAVSEPRGPHRDPEQVLEAIRQHDAFPTRKPAMRPGHAVPSQARRGRRPFQRFLAAAAIVGVLAGGWWTLQQTWLSGDRSAPATAFQEYRTERGQRASLAPPDGSTVLLGPESALRSAGGYGDRERAVELEGEGYFDVEHDDSRPFIVRAGNAVARDLGTRFVVRARTGEAAVEVAVAEGRVALSAAGQPVDSAAILDVRDVGHVDVDGETTVRRGVVLDRYLSWTEGRLVFEETPLSTVVTELSRWYAVDIRLEGEGLAEQQLTAAFDNMPVSRVMPMIQASLGLQLRRNGQEYVLLNR